MPEDAAAEEQVQEQAEQQASGIPAYLHRVWDDSSRAHNFGQRGFTAPAPEEPKEAIQASGMAVMPVQLFEPRETPGANRLRTLIAAYIKDQGEDPLPLLTAYDTLEAAERQAHLRVNAGRTGLRISKIATAKLAAMCCRQVRKLMEELEMEDSFERQVGDDEYLVSEPIPAEAICEEIQWSGDAEELGHDARL